MATNDEAARKHEVARKLAEQHYRTEEGITQIFRITQQVKVELLPTEPIKLLEVNKHTIASGIMPLGFDPAPASGFPYPSVIIEVTPEEFEAIQSGRLKLPRGWKLGPLLPPTEPKKGQE